MSQKNDEMDKREDYSDRGQSDYGGLFCSNVSFWFHCWCFVDSVVFFTSSETILHWFHRRLTWYWQCKVRLGSVSCELITNRVWIFHSQFGSCNVFLKTVLTFTDLHIYSIGSLLCTLHNISAVHWKCAVHRRMFITPEGYHLCTVESSRAH